MLITIFNKANTKTVVYILYLAFIIIRLLVFIQECETSCICTINILNNMHIQFEYNL